MSFRNKFYSVQNTPNTVSADRTADERSFVGVVSQSGKPKLDFELNLSEDVQASIERVFRRYGIPSGVLKTQRRKDPLDDYLFDLPGDPTFVANSFRMGKFTANVAGFPVTVEYTDTTTTGQNRVQLDAPPIFGSGPTKRTDFVFLEVWLSLVAPSVRATATVQVASLPSPGDTVTIQGNVLTAVAGAPGVDEFTVGGSVEATATNIATAVNLSANSFDSDVTAAIPPAAANTVTLYAVTAGTAGNSLTLASSVPLVLVPSGATFSGGADRPNKPTANTLYRHGNTQAPAGVNLADDLESPIVLTESSQRVQVQYRIRTTGNTENVNFKTEFDGFSNPNIVAQGGTGADQASYFFVPADNATTSGNSDASAYGCVDAGLWVAGAGDETSAMDLQTLDGFVYAIPLAMVFRRNNDEAGFGFDPVNNTNGGYTSAHGGVSNPFVGLIGAGLSDRPDGAFADVIRRTDVLDMRRHVSVSGVDWQSELQWQMKSLLDNNFSTWAVDIADKQTMGSGSGDVSTQFLVCNEIGREASKGGNNLTSGDTNRGVTVRSFDHFARRFGAQSVVERVVLAIHPEDRSAGPAGPGGVVDAGKYVIPAPTRNGDGWHEDDQIVIDFSVLNASTDGTWDLGTASLLASASVADFWPAGTKITDVLISRHDDGNTVAPVDQSVQFKRIEGLGTTQLVLTMDRNTLTVNGGVTGNPFKAMVQRNVFVGDGSERRVFIELEVTYPKGSGLTDSAADSLTPEATIYTDGAVLENDISQRPSDLEEIYPVTTRSREVALEYIASEDGAGTPIGGSVTEQFVSVDTTTLYFLRRVYGSGSFAVNVTDVNAAAPVAVDTSATEYGSSTRKVRLGAPLSVGQGLCTVTYYAQDAIPNYGGVGGGYQISVYYRSQAPQTVGSKGGAITDALPTTLTVQPLIMDRKLWTGQSGPGSVESPFPYEFPLDQIPVNDGGTASFGGEWSFCANTRISLSDFEVNTGLLNLPTLVEVDETIDFSFGNGGNPPQVDNEFRAFYDFADTATYRPTAFARPLAGATTHKVFMPFLARVTSDTGAFREGEVVLIVLSRFAELDAENSIRFVDTENRTCAGVYRTRSLLILSSED